MEDPRYGVEEPESIPMLTYEEASGRLLAGEVNGLQGPFKTAQSVQMIDFNLNSNAALTHSLQNDHDNCMIYVYKGDGVINGVDVKTNQIVRLDASGYTARNFTITASVTGLAAMLFSGKMLKEPIAWHGPFVMNTAAEIQDTLFEYRRGTFLKKRVPWDFKVLSTKPSDVMSRSCSLIAASHSDLEY
jgi:redox-sensitive bicupin YhaK (pirin superfamily)